MLGGAPGCNPAADPAGSPSERIAAAAAAVTAPTCVTIQRAGASGSVADAAIVSNNPVLSDKSYGAAVAGSTGQSTSPSESGQRSLLVRFDLSAIPQGWVVTSAVATLYAGSVSLSTTIRAHAITAAWSEATVTGNSFGTAFDPAVAASASAVQGYVGPLAFDLRALAQAWVNDPASDFGVLLEQGASGSTGFETSEWLTAAQRPKLVLCYQPPSCSDGIQNQGEQGVDCGGPCPTECPHPAATELVTSGQNSHSPQYKAVHTTGQPSINQDKSTSPSYRLQGGLIGANGNLP